MLQRIAGHGERFLGAMHHRAVAVQHTVWLSTEAQASASIPPTSLHIETDGAPSGSMYISPQQPPSKQSIANSLNADMSEETTAPLSDPLIQQTLREMHVAEVRVVEQLS
eukprot:jgi/Chrzof1/4466/Cz14g14090.t1